MKRIHIEASGDKTAKVYRDSEWDEYRVRLYLNGVLNAAADYHTEDKADAIATAAIMVRPETARPLSTAFNVAVNHICGRILPRGFDVSAAIQDYDSLMANYKKTGKILVWNGASEKTIFADAETNFAFRAWHDSKHITRELPFTLYGEYEVMKLQQADIRAIYDGVQADYFCQLLNAEIMGQAFYQTRHGGFPIDQIGFVKAYLSNWNHPGSTPCPIHSGAPLYGVSKESDNGM